MDIEYYQKCECGAVTIYTNGCVYSMRQSTAKGLGIDLRHYKRYPVTFCCDHCVNHFGIDICECGSGEPVGKCSCGSKRPMQELGVKFDSFQKIISNFTGYGC